MKPFIRNEAFIKAILIAALLVPCVIGEPTAAQSVANDLQTFFQNSTLPMQAQGSRRVATQTGNYLTLGGLQARSPINTYTLWNFTPPHFGNGGCGGIDMFLGGFSFINRAEFMAMMQNIAQNAQGYVFQLAIDAISPMISQMMKDFEAKLRSITDRNLNSCHAAQSLVNLAAGPAFDGMKSALCTNTNASDPANAQTDYSSASFWCQGIVNVDSQINAMNASTDASIRDPIRDNVGNLLFNALLKAGLTPASNAQHKNAIDLILSVSGFIILPPGNGTTTAVPSPNNAKGHLVTSMMFDTPQYGTVLGVNPSPAVSQEVIAVPDVIANDANGAQANAHIFQCNDFTDCLQPIDNANLPVNLIGQQVVADLKDIAQKIANPTLGTFSAEELGLIGASPIPFFGLMQYAEDVAPGGAQDYASRDDLSSYLGMAIIMNYLEWCNGYALMAFNRLEHFGPEKDQHAIAEMRANWKEFMDDAQRRMIEAKRTFGTDTDIRTEYENKRIQALNITAPSMAQRIALARHMYAR